MKKVIAVVFLVLLLGAVTSYAAGLKVGDKMVDFKFNAALDDKEYSLSSPEFAGKVVYIVYASVSSADDNDHVSDALLANKDIQHLKKENKYVGLGIGNNQDSPVPNFIIKRFARKSRRRPALSSCSIRILHSAMPWGLRTKSPQVILVDKQRIIRYIYSGKTPMENIPQTYRLNKEICRRKINCLSFSNIPPRFPK